jgi:uncharacterized protein
VGNIRDRSLADQAFSRQQLRFGLAKRETLPNFCKACPYLKDCWGECPKNRLLATPDGQPGLNYLCSGFRRFYGHSGAVIDQLVKNIGRPPS